MTVNSVVPYLSKFLGVELEVLKGTNRAPQQSDSVPNRKIMPNVPASM